MPTAKLSDIQPEDPSLQLQAMSVPEPKGKKSVGTQKATARLEDIEPEQVNYPPATPEQSFGQKAIDLAKGIGNFAKEDADVLGGITGGFARLTGPAGWGLSGLGAAGGQAIKQGINRFITPEVGPQYQFGTEGGVRSNFPQSTGESLEDLRNAFVRGAAGQGFTEGMNRLMGPAAKWIYGKLMGVEPTDSAGLAAVEEAVKRRIPLGLRSNAVIENMKAPHNEGLSDIIARAQPMQVQQYGQNTNLNIVSKRNLFDVVNDYYKKNKTIPIKEYKAFVDSFQNFLGRMPEDITLPEARAIKQYVQTKVPYGDETEGMQQARKTLAHYISDRMENAITNPADRAAFRVHSNELEKLIDVQDNLTKLNRNLSSKAWWRDPRIVAPAMGAATGGATGYYQHQDPATIITRSALTAAAMSPTGISRAALLANWLPFQTAASIAPRVGLKNMVNLRDYTQPEQ